jgi:hypothetical protein
VTIQELLAAVLPYLFFGLALLCLVCLGFVVVLSLRHRRTSSVVQVARLVVIAAAVVAVGIVSQRFSAAWAAGLFGLVAGGVIAAWYGRNTIRLASLGVNVSLIVLIAALMTLSIAMPEWLDARSFLIAGSLVGIRLLVATSPQTRLHVPSRRRGDRAMRIATIWMLLFAAAAAFVLAAGIAGAEVFNGGVVP